MYSPSPVVVMDVASLVGVCGTSAYVCYCHVENFETPWWY